MIVINFDFQKTLRRKAILNEVMKINCTPHTIYVEKGFKGEGLVAHTGTWWDQPILRL